MSHTIQFHLAIPPEEMVKYYHGTQWVYAQAVDGRRVQFPANRLQPFITRDGIYGQFQIAFDDQNRFVALTLIG